MSNLFTQNSIRVAVVGRNLEDLMPLLSDFPCRIVDDSPELVISHGGDGALLGAERRYPLVPKCPVRDRKRNPKCHLHDERLTLERLFKGELQLSYLERLCVSLETGEQLTGINDVILDRSEATSAIRYRIWVNGELFRPQVVADSLLVSTPFGSTGYFLSMTRGTFTSGIGLAFNNSMDLFGHSVVDTSDEIRVELLRGPGVLLADNAPQRVAAKDGDVLSIKVLPERTPLYGLAAFRCLACYDLRKNGICGEGNN